MVMAMMVAPAFRIGAGLGSVELASCIGSILINVTRSVAIVRGGASQRSRRSHDVGEYLPDKVAYFLSN